MLKTIACAVLMTAAAAPTLAGTPGEVRLHCHADRVGGRIYRQKHD